MVPRLVKVYQQRVRFSCAIYCFRAGLFPYGRSLLREAPAACVLHCAVPPCRWWFFLVKINAARDWPLQPAAPEQLRSGFARSCKFYFRFNQWKENTKNIRCKRRRVVCLLAGFILNTARDSYMCWPPVIKIIILFPQKLKKAKAVESFSCVLWQM